MWGNVAKYEIEPALFGRRVWDAWRAGRNY